jgi:hypothetical protein
VRWDRRTPYGISCIAGPFRSHDSELTRPVLAESILDGYLAVTEHQWAAAVDGPLTIARAGEIPTRRHVVILFPAVRYGLGDSARDNERCPCPLLC